MSAPPSDYICPLTKTLMSEPMLSRYGNHFERVAIMEWLNSGHNFCPVTGNPLRPSSLVSDKTLQWKINYWAKKNGKDISNIQLSTGETSAVGYVSIPQERFICPLVSPMLIRGY